MLYAFTLSIFSTAVGPIVSWAAPVLAPAQVPARPWALTCPKLLSPESAWEDAPPASPASWPQMHALFMRPISPKDQVKIDHAFAQIDIRKAQFDEFKKTAAGQKEIERAKGWVLGRQLSSSMTLRAQHSQDNADAIVRYTTAMSRYLSLPKVSAHELGVINALIEGKTTPSTYRQEDMSVGGLIGGVHTGLLPGLAQSDDLKVAMTYFFSWLTAAIGRATTGEQHPLDVAARAHEMLLSIHPYSNGNGRTARFLSNWILTRFGYPLNMMTNTNFLLSVNPPDPDDIYEPGMVQLFLAHGLGEYYNEIMMGHEGYSLYRHPKP
jgi:hypothetical protein